MAWLCLAALGLATVALLVSLAAWRRSGRVPGPVSRPTRRLTRTRSAPLTSMQVTNQLEELRADAATALRHVAVVRYDAFGDMGGHLSWSLALLDDEGDGMVVTAIHGRADTRTYAKNVAGWTGAQQLSPEESEAVALARRG